MKDTSKRLATIAAFLREQTTLALATANELGECCATPLFYIVDDAHSLYWISSPASQHSRTLQAASTVAATVHRHAENWREIRGVQLRGSVRVVSDPARRASLIELYCHRFQLGSFFRLTISQQTLYELRPTYFRFIDNSKHFGYKFEVELEPEA